jgi:uncharacterized cupredoxin-like copper-binding protein
MTPAITDLPRGIRSLAIAASAALLAVACGAAATSAPPSPTTVDVTLQEWAVLPATSTIKAGSVTFNVKNIGPAEEHEFVILKTDLDALSLPTAAGGKVDEAGTGVEAIGEIEEFASGENKTATFDLAPGKYVFICNIVDADGNVHYAKGMAAAVTVE